jgi:hypothetical protein
MWLPLILLILVVQPTASIRRCDKLRLCVAPLEALLQAPVAGRRRLRGSGVVGVGACRASNEVQRVLPPEPFILSEK